MAGFATSDQCVHPESILIAIREMCHEHNQELMERL